MVKQKPRYRFGELLRSVRERKQYTLKDVAGRVGVSESLISQIERNRVSPSIDTLLQIADVLEIDYEHLFKEYRQKRKVSLVKATQRKSLHESGVTIHQLSSDCKSLESPEIEALLFEIQPGAEKGNRDYGHTGWEFGTILEGQGRLIYGDETYELEAGDSIAFPSNIPHIFANTGSTSLRALWVVTPPRKMFQD
mgnify:CR=1 FL=1